jgi:hypothetical protein
LTALLTIGSIALIGLLASSPSPKPAIGKTSQVEGDVEIRRLTPDQYRNIIADVFGDSIKIGGHFEPGVREQGLLAVGAFDRGPGGRSAEPHIAHRVHAQGC